MSQSIYDQLFQIVSNSKLQPQQKQSSPLKQQPRHQSPQQNQLHRQLQIQAQAQQQHLATTSTKSDGPSQGSPSTSGHKLSITSNHNNNNNNNSNKSNSAHITNGTSTTKSTRNYNHHNLNKASHKSPNSSTSSNSATMTATTSDNDSTTTSDVARLLASLTKSNRNNNSNSNNSDDSRSHHNNHSSSTSSSAKNQQQQQLPQQSTSNGLSSKPDDVGVFLELRDLETWHDEDLGTLDESCYQELVDSGNTNGWSADDMFKYNERMHKITSSYNEKTIAKNYTTPLPKNNSKSAVRLASQLAREIEDKVAAEGRITPESSDDDELFETERLRKLRLKQRVQLDQMRDQIIGHANSQQQQPHYQRAFSTSSSTKAHSNHSGKTTKSSSQYSNSAETPATASLSSSPTMNETTIRPVTSSSRNILRACLS